MRDLFGTEDRFGRYRWIAQVDDHKSELFDQWNGSWVSVVARGWRQIGPDRALLILGVIGSNEDGSPACDTCGDWLWAFWLQRQGDGWVIKSKQDGFAYVGSRWDPGQMQWVEVGPGKIGLALNTYNHAMGESHKTLQLFEIAKSSRRVISRGIITIEHDTRGACESIPSAECREVLGQWQFDRSRVFGGYWALKIRFSDTLETRDGKKTTANTTAVYRIVNGKYSVHVGRNPAEE